MADFAKELGRAFEVTQKKQEEFKNKEDAPSSTEQKSGNTKYSKRY